MNTVTAKKDSPPIAGPKSLELFNEEQGYFTPGLQQIATFSKIAMEKGRGALLYDVDGKEYIDFIAGVGVASIGHGHPKYARAIATQVANISVGSFTTRNRVEFARRLVKHLPGELSRIQLYSSGAEAVEAAIRLAKSHTKNFEVLSFWGGFHGKTAGVLGLLGDSFKHQLGPIMPGLHCAPYPNPYRDPFHGSNEEETTARALDHLRQFIRKSTAGSLAAIILEPIQGTAGNIIPPKEFLHGVRKIAHENGALLIADEMITGFGRTGKWFGIEHFDASPDIITVGKGMAGGFPVSGVITTDAIASAKPFANPSGSSSSYGGNPLASAACNASLKIIEDENLVENSRIVGQFIIERLKTMQEKFPFIGEVRGRGLLIGVELVKDRKTKELISESSAREIFNAALKRGLITMAYNPIIRINPPLNITKEIATRGLDILEEAFEAVKF